MIALVAILAWLPMPMDSVTSEHANDWYAPVEIEYIDHEPSIEELDRQIKKTQQRILELQKQECSE